MYWKFDVSGITETISYPDAYIQIEIPQAAPMQFFKEFPGTEIPCQLGSQFSNSSGARCRVAEETIG